MLEWFRRTNSKSNGKKKWNSLAGMWRTTNYDMKIDLICGFSKWNNFKRFRIKNTQYIRFIRIFSFSYGTLPNLYTMFDERLSKRFIYDKIIIFTSSVRNNTNIKNYIIIRDNKIYIWSVKETFFYFPGCFLEGKTNE